ncbi:MAG: sulfite exporter TauE/SafE family protein [Firmicutes bacterium]|nr:sulfite exporter TauE/SafE family protein [Bacillota bacterium]
MKKTFLYAVIGIISGLINGILGAGGGTVIVPALEHFLHLPQQKAHATAISIILPTTIVSAFLYSKYWMTEGKTTLIVALFGMAGGFVGAKMLKKLSGKTIRIIFAISLMVAGVRMLWN